MRRIKRYLVGIQDSWLLTDQMTAEEKGWREIGVYALDLQTAASLVVIDYPGTFITSLRCISQSGDGAYYTSHHQVMRSRANDYGKGGE